MAVNNNALSGSRFSNLTKFLSPCFYGCMSSEYYSSNTRASNVSCWLLGICFWCGNLKLSVFGQALYGFGQDLKVPSGLRVDNEIFCILALLLGKVNY